MIKFSETSLADLPIGQGSVLYSYGHVVRQPLGYSSMKS